MSRPARGLEERPASAAAGDDERAADPAPRFLPDLESRSTLELVELMSAEDRTVPEAVAASAEAIAGAVDEIAAGLRAGGRLVYVGAGTSGRLAVLDAAECEPTFGVETGTVLALVAGGASASPLVQEAAEDDRDAGAADVAGVGVTAPDVVVGVSASGRTPYTIGALEAAMRAGASTVAVVCAEGSELERIAGRAIVVVVGPELLAGSTRLKAGTAQKLVLNMLSTLAMVRLGKTYGNLMVDVVPSNEKLRARVHGIVRAATGASPAAVDAALAAADGDARVAIVSLLAGVNVAEARRRLDAAGRSIARAVEP